MCFVINCDTSFPMDRTECTTLWTSTTPMEVDDELTEEEDCASPMDIEVPIAKTIPMEIETDTTQDDEDIVMADELNELLLDAQDDDDLMDTSEESALDVSMDELMMIFNAMSLKDDTHKDIVMEELKDELLLDSQDDNDLMDTSEEPVMDAAIENLMMIFKTITLTDDTPAIAEPQELTPAAKFEDEPMENGAIMEALMTQSSAVTLTLIDDTPVLAEQEPAPADLKLDITIIEIAVAAQDKDEELALVVATEPEIAAVAAAGEEELVVAPQPATESATAVITTAAAAIDTDIDELISLFKALTATDSLEQLPTVLPLKVVSAETLPDASVIFDEAPALLIDVIGTTEAADTETPIAVDTPITALPTLASVTPATTYTEEVAEPAADEPESSLSDAPATTYIEEVAEPAAEDDVSSPIAPATETTATHRILDSPSEAVRPAILRTLWTGAESWRKIDTRRTAVNRALLVGTALSGFVATLVTYQ
jgi:hypothetical protein